ncbi:MAG TPA: hypothetical protein VMF06_23760 [Candidatus Limnocylindria bacterium]|jgi:hypothetical protein|nr:hypothetical protein [Candidatus Limnocylindria bacterium]
MNSGNAKGGGKLSGFFTAVVVLGVVLAVLFNSLLSSGKVMFSNDAPLGLLAAQADIVWSNFQAYWTDLNWVGGSFLSGAPSITPVAYAILGPVLYAKWAVPLCLLLLGLSGWFFARNNKFGNAVAILTGLAAALNSNPVSYACWGLPPKAVTMGAMLVAVGLLHLQARTQGWRRWAQIVLAGFAVGVGVAEGADVGAILSLYVAAFAAWQYFAEPAKEKGRAVRVGLALALVAICAAWFATHSLSSLVGTQIKGVAGMDQNQESKEQRWEFATFGSLPPAETLRIVVPGLFGYRMDTPNGGAYWGGVGSDGKPEHRFSGSGEYAGVLVILLAVFAVANALRRERSPYTESERRYVWFWAVAAALSLLMAYGRFAPFYRALFELPYFSTIRFPMKFLHGMDICLVILFGYGLEAVARLYLAPGKVAAVDSAWGRWWSRVEGWNWGWLLGSWIAVGVAMVLALLYTASFQSLEQYIAAIPFQDDKASAWFSIGEVWKAVGFLALSVGVVTLALAGWFAESRLKFAWWVFGLILVADLVRANLPWVKAYDYRTRYQSNVLFDVLKARPWEHRVSAYLAPQRLGLMVATTEFAYLQKEWLENQFQYFHIQSLDIDQMARTPELDKAYLQAFVPPQLGLAAQIMQQFPQLDRLSPEQAGQLAEFMPTIQSNLFSITRLWELTNTRFIFGWASGIDRFNQMFDPVQRRFKVRMPYGLGLMPGATPPASNAPIADAIQSYTAIPSDKGPLALIEFSGALPRARLYNRWETITNGAVSLARLTSPNFNPEDTVIVDGTIPGFAPSASPGKSEVSFDSYSPKHLVLKSKSDTAGVLLLNDRWHENWRAFVDGQPAPVFRANFLMRGVPLSPGEHSVELKFVSQSTTLWVSLGAVVSGFLLAGLLMVVPGQKSEKT